MKLQAKLLLSVAVILLIMSSSVTAGGTHYGAASSREGACSNAEAKARRAAREKDTCYDECDIRKCTKEDGEYMCYTHSANHSGSCNQRGKIKP